MACVPVARWARCVGTVMLLGATLVPPTGHAAVAVPPDYARTYQELQSRLDRFDALLAGRLREGAAVVIYGAELITANAHRGEELLTEAGSQGNLMFLDRLQSLGVKGVTVKVAYPLLQPEFPRSAEYLAFYKKVAVEVRRRGLKLHVKTGPLFKEREFTSVRVDYSGLTPERYFAERGREARLLVAELQPDYLTIANEPSTESGIVGFSISPQRYVQFINAVIQDVGRSSTLIGAGSGTWDDIAYVRSFAQNTTLDYIDLHIYPLASTGRDYLASAVEMIDLARRYNKKVIIGEFWLYKASAAEVTGTPAAVEVFARDPFSFWSPLDQRMLEVVARLARWKQVEYVSPFWSKYFYGYLEYNDSTRILSALQLTRLANVEATKNIAAGTLSPTGLKYRQIIRGSN